MGLHLLMNIHLRTSILSVRLPDKQLYVGGSVFPNHLAILCIATSEDSALLVVLIGAQATFRGLILTQSSRPTRGDQIPTERAFLHLKAENQEGE